MITRPGSVITDVIMVPLRTALDSARDDVHLRLFGKLPMNEIDPEDSNLYPMADPKLASFAMIQNLIVLD